MSNSQNIDLKLLIALLHLKDIGPKTALKLISRLNYKLLDINDLKEFISENALAFRLNEYHSDDFINANDFSEMVLDNSKEKNIEIITYFDDKYPKNLLLTDDYPLILNYKGNISHLNNTKSIAVVGTRKPTLWGSQRGQEIAEKLALKGVNIVSGLAIGCDTVAHQGALRAKGLTTAVLAHGLNYVYPRSNSNLAQEIVDNDGLLISEYFVNEPLNNAYYVPRNRIQAGLSSSVFIIESALKGGTMHTANKCVQYSRVLACLSHPEDQYNEETASGNKILINEKNAESIFDQKDFEEYYKLVLNHDFKNEDNQLSLEL